MKTPVNTLKYFLLLVILFGIVLGSSPAISSSIAPQEHAAASSPPPMLLPEITPGKLRNPFLAPQHKAVIQDASNLPILRGIIKSESQAAILIDYDGTSNFYVAGSRIGPYTVTQITDKYAVLHSQNQQTVLHIER